MKNLLAFLLFSTVAPSLYAQDLQLLYDARHTLDPAHNTHNFPTLYFQYFKSLDSGKAFIKPGSFLLKIQADLQGEKHNIGQAYVQVSQSFRCWEPPIFLSLQYSGGLGVTEPKQYSFYIDNAYAVGLSYPFQWKGAWLSAVLNYKYIARSKPTRDPQFTLYWWSGYFNYKLEFSGDFSIWTENKDRGEAFTTGYGGKRFFFFGEPQLWYNINKVLSLGVKVYIYYHVYTADELLQAYPTAAVRFKL
jgi:hypothetical protein